MSYHPIPLPSNNQPPWKQYNAIKKTMEANKGLQQGKAILHLAQRRHHVSVHAEVERYEAECLWEVCIFILLLQLRELGGYSGHKEIIQKGF